MLKDSKWNDYNMRISSFALRFLQTQPESTISSERVATSFGTKFTCRYKFRHKIYVSLQVSAQNLRVAASFGTKFTQQAKMHLNLE